MNDEGGQSKGRKGRAFALGGENIFKDRNGGRPDYGGLIISALTGMSQSELLDDLEKRGVSEDKVRALRKNLSEGGEVNSTLLDSEDQFFQDYLRIQAGPSLIAPPIAPERLERLVSENNALEPCIAAMVTNISCTGYELQPSKGSESDLTDEQKEKRQQLMDFLREVYPRKSFTTTRKQLRRDLHATGNSYTVLERTPFGELAFIRRAPSKSMRLIKLDDPVPVKIKMNRMGKEVEFTAPRAERRYVQKIGTKLVYYKEYGAERDLHKITGKWHQPGELDYKDRAHEIIHDKDIEDDRTPYGMPRWITQLPSVLGSRMAEEHNLAFFQSGGVPPIIVFISGGIASEQVMTTLNNYLSGGAKDKQRGVAVEVPTSGDLNAEKAAAVQVERFGSQEADSTFETYDQKNEERVRRAFRLPGIFLGMADSYNFATAHASYVVAEAQVFAPERDEEDERLNMTIMREIDPEREWELVSNPLSVQDVNLQLRALQMLSTQRGVGLKDLVDEIAKVAGLELEVAKGYEAEVVGDMTNLLAPQDSPGAGAPANNPAAPGATPQTPDSTPQRPSTPVANTVRNRLVGLATRISRCIRAYDDFGEETELQELMQLRAEYERLAPQYQEIVNRALAPALYNAPFLSDAAMADIAKGYAVAAFHTAERTLKKGPMQ